MRSLVLVLALVLALSATAHAAIGDVVIQGATVHTGTGTPLEGATVVVRKGKIVALGATVAAPEGARVIDGRGLVVTAGLIDSLTSLGLVEVDLVAETNDQQQGPTEIHAATRVTDAWNPASIAIPVTRAGGVTTIVAVPRGGLVQGSSSAFSLGVDQGGPASVRRAFTAVHATLGRGAVEAGHGSRAAAVERLREVLNDAADHAKRRAAFERRQTREYTASRLDLEALGPVVRGELPLIVRADRAADIRAALGLAKELGITLVIAGGAEAWQVAAELAAAKVPVILDPVANIPGSFDAVHVRDDGAALLRAAGVDVAITPIETQAGGHRLRQAAGIAVAHGLAWTDALAAITSVPARIYRLAGRGVLAAGGPADLVVWDGDPLDTTTRPRHVFIDGLEQPLTTRQTLLLQRYRRLPARP